MQLLGLPDAIIEKNLDAELLSPATLIATAAGRPVTLVRGNAKTGKIERLPGVILSGPDADGVVFQTQDGIEALRCSGLPEGFNFAGTRRLAASPTLSVVVRTTRSRHATNTAVLSRVWLRLVCGLHRDAVRRWQRRLTWERG